MPASEDARIRAEPSAERAGSEDAAAPRRALFTPGEPMPKRATATVHPAPSARHPDRVRVTARLDGRTYRVHVPTDRQDDPRAPDERTGTLGHAAALRAVFPDAAGLFPKPGRVPGSTRWLVQHYHGARAASAPLRIGTMPPSPQPRPAGDRERLQALRARIRAQQDAGKADSSVYPRPGV